MGTRATVCFWQEGELTAQVFRSGDGFPSGLGADLQVFLQIELRDNPNDTRFDDMGVLAARWVHYEMTHYAATHMDQVAIIMEEYDDVEYRYHVSYGSVKYAEHGNVLTVTCHCLDKGEESIFLTLPLTR